MRGFIEFYDKSREEHVLLNVGQIVLVTPGADRGRSPRKREEFCKDGQLRFAVEEGGETPDPRDSDCAEVHITSQCRFADDGILIPHYGHGSRQGETIPYRKVVEMIRDAQCPQPCSQLRGCVAQTKEEKEPSPRTPHKEKEERLSLPPARARKKAPFTKPTLEDIAAYCAERKNGLDAQLIWDFYESKGWKVGGQPMKNWKACVRTWERRKSFPVASAAASRTVRRRPDNWIGCSDAERKEFIDGLA